MAHLFDYELLGARSWTELRDLLYRADEEGGWQAVGYSVVDGVHHVLMKRPRQSVAENSGAVGGEGPDS